MKGFEMAKAVKWVWFFNKRLYKKPTFVVLLGLIPLLALLLALLARQESGFLTVALVAEEGGDVVTAALFEELAEGSELMLFRECPTVEEAVEAVRAGEADAAWIFPKETAAAIAENAGARGEGPPVVTVVVREETIPLRLSYEKLSGALYPYSSRALYLDFVRTELPELDGLTEEQLNRYYDGFTKEDTLFLFETADGAAEGIADTGYLLAPVRGLFAVVTVLAALAAALYFIEDEKKGVFALVPSSKMPFAAFACQLIAVGNVAAVMQLSVYLSGVGVSLWRELAALLPFVLCCCLFGMLLQQVGSVRVLCALLPLLSVLLIAVCPIFFDFRSLWPLQLLFPPTYYVRLVYAADGRYALYTAGYLAGMAAIYALLQKVRRRSIASRSA